LFEHAHASHRWTDFDDLNDVYRLSRELTVIVILGA